MLDLVIKDRRSLQEISLDELTETGIEQMIYECRTMEGKLLELQGVN